MCRDLLISSDVLLKAGSSFSPHTREDRSIVLFVTWCRVKQRRTKSLSMIAIYA